MRVLMVDDDAAIRRMLATILEIEGAGVVAAASAAEALKALGEERFDLVITDMRMETPTAGLLVVSAANQCENHPPVVVLTAFPVLQADVRVHGDAVIMQKGSDPRGLIHQLRSMLALASKRVEPASETLERRSKP